MQWSLGLQSWRKNEKFLYEPNHINAEEKSITQEISGSAAIEKQSIDIEIEEEKFEDCI